MTYRMTNTKELDGHTALLVALLYREPSSASPPDDSGHATLGSTHCVLQ